MQNSGTKSSGTQRRGTLKRDHMANSVLYSILKSFFFTKNSAHISSMCVLSLNTLAIQRNKFNCFRMAFQFETLHYRYSLLAQYLLAGNLITMTVLYCYCLGE
jgi:hypothetical protein